MQQLSIINSLDSLVWISKILDYELELVMDGNFVYGCTTYVLFIERGANIAVTCPTYPKLTTQRVSMMFKTHLIAKKRKNKHGLLICDM
jgi:hypothetical protein